jgi:type VI secretion system protein ImpC
MNQQTATAAAPSAAQASAGTSLLDEIVEKSKVAKSDSEHARAKDLIGELVHQVMDGTVVVSDNLSATIDARIAELDRLLSAQLSEVMHAPEFQRMESTWRGLNYLCKESNTGSTIKIRVLNANKREIVRDFKAASEFDQSALFKKVYEEEFGTFGGAPFGTLIGDFELTRQPEDMYFIEQMSHVAAAAHAPFITSASPEILGLESFADLGKPRDLGKSSTSPPPSTPRIAAHQPKSSNAAVSRVANAHAALHQRYLLWSEPSTLSTKLNFSAMSPSFGWNGRRPR